MRIGKVLPLCARVLVTALIFWLILRSVEPSAILAAFSRIQWPFLAAAVALAATQLSLAVERWRAVAATFDHDITRRQAYAYKFIALLVNKGLPTGVGGDAYRTWSLHRDGLSIAHAARIIVTERLCAFASLLIVIGLGLPLLAGMPGEAVFKYVAPAVFVVGVLGLAGLMMFGRIKKFLPDFRVFSAAGQASRDLNRALFGSSGSFQILLWSLSVQFCRLTILLVLALGLGLQIPAADLFAIAPASFLIAMAPITVGGWGLREAVFINSLSLAGVASSDALALSILFGLVWLFMSLMGGLIWIVERNFVEAPPKQT